MAATVEQHRIDMFGTTPSDVLVWIVPPFISHSATVPPASRGLVRDRASQPHLRL